VFYLYLISINPGEPDKTQTIHAEPLAAKNKNSFLYINRQSRGNWNSTSSAGWLPALAAIF
jgi:hypothetical protein